MRIPQRPPSLAEITLTPERLTAVLTSGINRIPPDQYLHWDKLRRKPPPQGFTKEEWWFATKMFRMATWRELPLHAKDGKPFRVVLSDNILQMLHRIDQQTTGMVEAPPEVTNRQHRDRYLVSSLLEEAIRSSQLEGAATTTRVAKDMLRAGRKPRDHSERMIYNNYQAMEFVREIADQDLSAEAILELHKIVTRDTLQNEHAAGAWRTAEDQIVITDQYNDVLHEPPAAHQIEARIADICRFANQSPEEGGFLHPVIRAILIHFMIAYDHPFVDGNGRTARALYYWYLVRCKYWLMEFVSISTILHKQPAKYAVAYLLTESDDNDTTYFVDYNLRVINAAIVSLYEYLNRKAGEIRDVDSLLSTAQVRHNLNYRQIALLGHALKNPRADYTIQSHQKSHGVTYQTARTDLLSLAEMQVLDKVARGRAFVFMTPSDLRERLLSFSGSFNTRSSMSPSPRNDPRHTKE